MQYEPVASSNIAALAHDPKTDTLGVRFHGGTEYHYEGVSVKIFNSIKGAASVGRAFNETIKMKPRDYPYRKVA